MSVNFADFFKLLFNSCELTLVLNNLSIQYCLLIPLSFHLAGLSTNLISSLSYSNPNHESIFESHANKLVEFVDS